jgi:cysteine synthase B
MPKIYSPENIDRIMDVDQVSAENTTRELAAKEGIFSGISSGGAVAVALQLSKTLDNSVIVAIICDRGDRYLSTGVFPS